MLKYYDFSGVSFLVDKRFKCEIASENASARFDLAAPLIMLVSYSIYNFNNISSAIVRFSFSFS